MSNVALYSPVHDPNYITGPGPDTPVLIGGVLELIMAFACIGTAVVLYPVVKRRNQGTALGFAGARVLEAGTIFAGVVSLLAVVTLRKSGAGAASMLSCFRSTFFFAPTIALFLLSSIMGPRSSPRRS